MHRSLRDLCLLAALAPLAAHGGEVRISIRTPWIVPALAALFPPPPPLPPSPHHLSLQRRERAGLQVLLDSGPMKIKILHVEESGIRIVTRARNG